MTTGCSMVLKRIFPMASIRDLVVVAAKTDPENNPHHMTLFLVERGMEGFERGRNLEKMGLKAQDTAELFFNDVKVPKANVLGEPGQGFIYLMKGLAEERLIGAAGYIACPVILGSHG